MWTASLGGAAVDLGAQWIEGIDGNPVMEFCRERQIKTQLSDPKSVRPFDTDGHPLEGDELDDLRRRAAQLLGKLDSLNYQSYKSGGKDVTVADGVKQVLDGAELTDRQRRYLRYAVAMKIESTEGDDAERISLRSYECEGEPESFGGPQHILPQGYGQVPAALARGLDIRLSHTVTAIAHTTAGVTVTTGSKQFMSDYAVVTLPLAVLKSGKITFTPALPKGKQEAMAAIHAGAAHKVVLRFEKQFWSASTDFIGYATDQPGRFVEWTDLSRVNQAPILSLWSHGDAARKLEKLTKEEIVAAAMPAVRAVFGSDAPEPTAALTTRWTASPLSLGAYVYLPLGATFDMLDALAAPIDNRLFFAGEATSRRHRATVHGAWLSGQRAADQIIGV